VFDWLEDQVANPEKEFQDDLATIRADIAALTDTVGKLASEAVKAQAAFAKDAKKAAKRATSIGEEMWEEAQQLGSDTAEAAGDAAQAGMATLERQIKQNPVSAVLISLGIGFLVGILGSR
jgi:ElaB/YqjD/DUF883 family membrane-anchored ribosome-binding protein